MKMVLSVMNATNADKVVNALNRASFRVTRFGTTGGFLRRGNVTIMVATEDENVPKVTEIIKQESPDSTADNKTIGTVVFVLDVEQGQRV
ncbi:MAG: hypothetical protein EXR62_04040 [Chloroflexi bacterium]|nr:hypothetical protein [Chloroflexota bacterium]